MSALLETVLEAIRARRADVERRYGMRLVGVGVHFPSLIAEIERILNERPNDGA